MKNACKFARLISSPLGSSLSSYSGTIDDLAVLEEQSGWRPIPGIGVDDTVRTHPVVDLVAGWRLDAHLSGTICHQRPPCSG